MKPVCLGVFILFVANAASATPPVAATIVNQGNGKGAAPCSSCHGTDGGGQAAAGFPRLAGLDAVYLEHQLDSFADGTRASPIMTPIAKALTENERHELAEYYNHMPIPAAAARGVATPNYKLGEALATQGMWSKQVPGCVKCHGPGGVGVGANFPPLAGQSATYLANQLHDWQQGQRKNDSLGLMQHVASSLSEADIRAVTAWFAAQPAVWKEKKP